MIDQMAEREEVARGAAGSDLLEPRERPAEDLPRAAGAGVELQRDLIWSQQRRRRRRELWRARPDESGR